MEIRFENVEELTKIPGYLLRKKKYIYLWKFEIMQRQEKMADTR